MRLLMQVCACCRVHCSQEAGYAQAMDGATDLFWVQELPP